jgi:hypothetical protein
MSTVKISAWVSSIERQTIQERAAASGLSMSQYISVTALSSMPQIEVLQSLYLKAGEAHTLANLVLEKYRGQPQYPIEEVELDLTDLIQVTTKIHTLLKELIH